MLDLGLRLGQGRRAGGVVVSPTAQLRALLYGEGQLGLLCVCQPIVDGEQALFQDAAGTVPVTADGDPAGLMLDLSGNGNHATQAISADRPIYRTDGTRHWLQFNGVNQFLQTAPVDLSAYTAATLIAVTTRPPDTACAIGHGTDGNDRLGLWARIGSSAGAQYPGAVSAGAVTFPETFGDSGEDMLLTALVDRLAPSLSAQIDNGVSSTSSQSQGTWSGNTPIYIGTQYGSGGPFLDGKFYGGSLLTRLLSDELPAAKQYFASLAGITL